MAQQLLLSRAIDQVLIELEPQQAFLRDFSDEGGRIDLQVSGEWIGSSPVRFDYELTARLASLRINLVFE